MAVPAFAAAGAGASAISVTTLSLPYPAGISAGELLLLHLYRDDNSATPVSAVNGFELKYSVTALPTSGSSMWIYSKTAAGSESGNLAITVPSVGPGWFGRIYRFTGDAGTWTFEGGGSATGTDSTIEIPSLTTLGADRLAIAMIASADDNTIGSATGETGGNWTEAVAEYASSDGSDAMLQLQTADMPSAATISGGVATQSANDPWGVRSFAISVVAGGGGGIGVGLTESLLLKPLRLVTCTPEIVPVKKPMLVVPRFWMPDRKAA